MDKEEVVHIKVFHKETGDVVFEGKVSSYVSPDEMTKLVCFRECGLSDIMHKGTSKEVKSFKGLKNGVELEACGGGYARFEGILYVTTEDGVLRRRRRNGSVPSSQCSMMSAWDVSPEDCEKIFKCETLEELEVIGCKMAQIPKDVGKMKNLKKLRLFEMRELKVIPDAEMGELSSLEELQIDWCGIETLPKSLKQLKSLKSLKLTALSLRQIRPDDIALFSRLKHLEILHSKQAFTPSPNWDPKSAFLQMIKVNTNLRHLEWDLAKDEMLAALEENGSIVSGNGPMIAQRKEIYKRNASNHKRTMENVLRVIAIKRFKRGMVEFPKEMVDMIGKAFWITRCDIFVR